MNFKLLRFGLLTIFCMTTWTVSPLYALTHLVLDGSQKQIPLGRHMEFAEDKSGSWTIDMVASPSFSHPFIPGTSDFPNFGFTDSVYWGRLQLQNPLKQNTPWYLELAHPRIDHIQIFIRQPDGRFVIKTSGDHLPFEHRDIPHRNIVFVLSLPPQTLQDIYIRIESEASIQMFFTLWTPETFVAKSTEEHFVTGLYFGSLLIMILYNLFLFASIRNRSYLFYVLFITAIIFWQSNHYGVAYQYLWPHFPTWANLCVPLSGLLVILCFFLFTRSFLETSTLIPVWDKILRVFIGILFLFLPLSLILRYRISIQLAHLTAFFAVFIILIVVLVSFFKGSRSARFFLLAYFLLLTTAIINILKQFGIIPIMFITEYGVQIGSTLEVLLLSLGLADRINTLKKENFLAQAKVVETQAKLLKAQEETVLAQKQSIENLRQVDQLKDEFLANTSHELRTPLNGIIGIAESLMEGATGKLSRDTHRNLNLIVQSGKRLANMVNDVLDFSKMKHNDLHLNLLPMDIHNLTQWVLTLSRPLLKQNGVVLHSEIPENLPLVDADENRLQQILLNLVGNAIKFTDQGEICVRAESRENQVWVSVSDTGIGIPQDKQERIFEAFEQGDGSQNRIHEGTGLGLSITKKLVELHGGKIFLESTEGKGSTFSFNLAISEKQTLPETSLRQGLQAHQKEAVQDIQEALEFTVSPENPDQQPSPGKTILVVDDEPVNVQVVQNHLQMRNYRVLTACDGAEALDVLEKNKPDLIVLDLMMPRMNGYEVTQHIRKQYTQEELPIVMLTAKNQVRDLVESYASGVNDYLTKPFHKEELLSRVGLHIQLQDAIHHLEDKVKERTLQFQKVSQELSLQNQVMMEDLKTAAILQSRLFTIYDPPEFLKVAVCYHPHHYVSGDMYKMYEDELGGFNLFLGDSTGHGVAAALTTMMANILLSQKANVIPHYVMEYLNDHLTEQLPDDRFMTGVLLQIRKEGKLTCLNAGHPPVILVPASGDAPLLLSPKSFMLGVFHTPEFQCKASNYTLQPGDLGIFFTDGLTERKNSHNDLFGEERLIQFMRENREMEVEPLLNKLLQELDNFAEGEAPNDDVSAIVFRYVG
ncbi:MAG: SpoIIE family protein phosphatase [SAR324 cluster bacterium]|nr:SpoIIE family protein phosphatase [SAR324 cluster bacterium]